MHILFNIQLLVATSILIVLKYKVFEVRNYNYTTAGIFKMMYNIGPKGCHYYSYYTFIVTYLNRILK